MEDKSYVIKKIKTRDISEKDRENIENEVKFNFNLQFNLKIEGLSSLKIETFKYRFDLLHY